MALSIILPKYAFTNNFPVLTVSGSASSKLQGTFTWNGTVVLDDENYYFDTDGMASIRGLGDLADRYFYDTNYDIRRFSLSASITIKAEQ